MVSKLLTFFVETEVRIHGMESQSKITEQAPQHDPQLDPNLTKLLPGERPGRTVRKRTKARKPAPVAATSNELAHHADKPKVPISDFMDMLCAIHFSSYVPSPIQDAGGIAVVGPSGTLKSTVITSVSNLYPAKCICDSNWYFGKLVKMGGSFYNRSIRSIIVPELSSIYAGDPRTSGRIENMFQQMAGEGSFSTNEADSRFCRYEMRATIFFALTPEFCSKMNKKWEEGFHRRFLWAFIAMENDEILLDYLIKWKRAEIEISRPIMEPATGVIPDLLTEKEKRKVSDLLINQKVFGPNHTRFVTYTKAISVLRWHYKRMGIKRDAMETAEVFSGCLSQKAALLIIPRVKQK